MNNWKNAIMKNILTTIIIMGLLSFLFGCKSKSGEKQIIEVDGKKINTVESENPLGGDYGLKDLTEQQKSKFDEILVKAKQVIEQYIDVQNANNVFNATNLDVVLEKWKEDSRTDKVSQDNLIEMIGCAFGQNIIDDLDCEWQILTDEYGTDFTVIHKKYKINGFPFSSVFKAIDQDRKGSLNEIKLLLKKNITDAKNGADYDER